MACPQCATTYQGSPLINVLRVVEWRTCNKSKSCPNSTNPNLWEEIQGYTLKCVYNNGAIIDYRNCGTQYSCCAY